MAVHSEYILLVNGQQLQVLTSSKYKPKKGSGIYTQKKRNAYKVSQNGQYGGLVIDLPKLFGNLKVVAHKNGQKVYDKQADFDTIDLLTKRFNSKKKYSNLSRMIFDELNQLSEIPIHRTSNKFKRMGSGVIYYNNPNDLLDRMELLGGSILAGNDGVKKEFTQIAHTLLLLLSVLLSFVLFLSNERVFWRLVFTGHQVRLKSFIVFTITARGERLFITA